MKVRAVQRFYDGWEKRVRAVGDVFETTEERFEYWNSASLVVLDENDGDETPDLAVMTKADLLAFAQEHGVDGVDDSMRKGDIVSAIREAMGWTQTKA